MNDSRYQLEAEKTLKFFRNLFFSLLFLFAGVGLILGLSGKVSVEVAENSCISSAQASVSDAHSQDSQRIADSILIVKRLDSLRVIEEARVADSIKVAASIKLASANKTKSKTSLSAGQRKKLVRDKWGWFFEMACNDEGLDTCHIDTLIALGVHESGANPYAKNDSSSATGFFQFITATGVHMAEELGLGKEYYNPKDVYLNIRMGIKYYKKNLKIHHSAKWAILAHYTGTYAAKDTANFYGGVDKTPFVKLVTGVLNAPYDDPPQWAMAKWRKY
jgi:hypothetical protein